MLPTPIARPMPAWRIVPDAASARTLFDCCHTTQGIQNSEQDLPRPRFFADQQEALPEHVASHHAGEKLTAHNLLPFLGMQRWSVDVRALIGNLCQCSISTPAALARTCSRMCLNC